MEMKSLSCFEHEADKDFLMYGSTQNSFRNKEKLNIHFNP